MSGCNGCGGCNGSEKQNGVKRRTLLGWLVGVLNAGVAGTILAPTLGFVASPVREKRKPAVWVPILSDGELKEGETRYVTYELEVQDGYMQARRSYSAYLHRKGGRVVAYDPSCPHLGCHVEFKPRKKRYVCPCHGGVFAEDGQRISGPPPRGLARIAAKVEDGRIWIEKV